MVSGYPDSNRGPFAPEANALPSCATPRFASLRPTRGLVPAEGFEPTYSKERIYSPPRLNRLRRAGMVVSDGFEPPTSWV